jgi:hypothetical protein
MKRAARSNATGASAQSGDYAEKSRHIFRVDRSGTAQQKKELRRDQSAVVITAPDVPA